jgi:hypothetical protein
VAKLVKEMGSMIQEEIEIGTLQVTPPLLAKHDANAKRPDDRKLSRDNSKGKLLGKSAPKK